MKTSIRVRKSGEEIQRMKLISFSGPTILLQPQGGGDLHCFDSKTGTEIHPEDGEPPFQIAQTDLKGIKQISKA
jgi:hypothetical protein